MQALKVGDLGLISGLDQGFKSLLDERSQSTTEDGLFSEQITLRLFFESGLQNSVAGRANSVGVAKRVSLCLLRAGSFGIEAEHNVVAAVAQILRLRMSLATVAQNCDHFAL